MKNIIIVICVGLCLVSCEKDNTSSKENEVLLEESNVSIEEKNISLVKNGILKLNKTLTVGEAIDNYAGCIYTQWESFTSDNGIKIVQATCPLTEYAKKQLFWSDQLQLKLPKTTGNKICKKWQNRLKKHYTSKQSQKYWKQKTGIDVKTFLKMIQSNQPEKTNMNLILQFSINKDNKTFQVAHIVTSFQLELEKQLYYPTYAIETLENIYNNLTPSLDIISTFFVKNTVPTSESFVRDVSQFLALYCPYVNR